ncbi:NADH-quinone oxidoreductase subunit C [Pseudofrankia inefficax]|uniref:NADH-quinone oxidoreductase subunit C n=1 Tax=Pseudofrankia inefficax (strain DSM 45817 / CECT 9037 / DDB 130130 / EuI1c) TaxID=298654 RepID=E3J4J2_PSEI1|nr:NADH-quinone oxidoreductase subunit C [Pseudofrankia inefficax]ADP84256.1 NADH (or F420H2) dehydrogenase, subunit C [Pseudofrankia inefficax]
MSDLEQGGGAGLNGRAGARHDAFGAKGSGDTSGFGGLVAPARVLSSSERPFGDEHADAIYDALERAFAGLDEAIELVVVDRGELTLHVRRERLLDVARTLRDDPALRFELLSSLSGADYPDDPSGRRLHSVAHLLSLTHRRRIRVEVSVSVEDPTMPSLTPVWPTADWHERETYDFFGIVYEGHHALTRIMMPDDWIGHPQRKDYPLGGIPVDYKGAQVPPPEKRRSYS